MAKSHSTTTDKKRQANRKHGFKPGCLHPDWKGDRVGKDAGRTRARKAFPVLGKCEECGKDATERHHKDGSTANNEPSNIALLCRSCHMKRDGRLEAFRQNCLNANTKANAQRWKNRIDTTARPHDPCPRCEKRMGSLRKKRKNGSVMVSVVCLKNRGGCGFRAGSYKEAR